jgi:hypothetical protein
VGLAARSTLSGAASAAPIRLHCAAHPTTTHPTSPAPRCARSQFVVNDGNADSAIAARQIAGNRGERPP